MKEQTQRYIDDLYGQLRHPRSKFEVDFDYYKIDDLLIMPALAHLNKHFRFHELHSINEKLEEYVANGYHLEGPELVALLVSIVRAVSGKKMYYKSRQEVGVK